MLRQIQRLPPSFSLLSFSLLHFLYLLFLYLAFGFTTINNTANFLLLILFWLADQPLRPKESMPADVLLGFEELSFLHRLREACNNYVVWIDLWLSLLFYCFSLFLCIFLKDKVQKPVTSYLKSPCPNHIWSASNVIDQHRTKKKSDSVHIWLSRYERNRNFLTHNACMIYAYNSNSLARRGEADPGQRIVLCISFLRIPSFVRSRLAPPLVEEIIILTGL